MRQNSKQLVLKNGTKREEICNGIAKLAQRVNGKHAPPAIVRTRAEVGVSSIGVEFSWKNTDEEQDLQIQEGVRQFALNGFAVQVADFLSKESNWKEVKVQRSGRRRGGKKYVCLITAL